MIFKKFHIIAIEVILYILDIILNNFQNLNFQNHINILLFPETDISNGKVKAATKDCSTQTNPPPSPNSNSILNNSQLNNSQEHLQKVNNNCNVGNGPLGIISGVQIKELPL